MLIQVQDDGHGLDDFQKLLSFHESGWDADTCTQERPFGVGFSKCLYAASRCVVASGRRRVDIDTAAVTATQGNAQANGVTLAAGLPDHAAGTYPLVLANILATPLKLLAPLLCAHVAPGGHLVLAGILERQAEELKAAYAPWLALDVADTQDGWILMTGCRATAAGMA